MRNGHVAMRGQVILTKSPKSVWERKKREKKRKRKGKCGVFRERSSTFSLKFSAIGPAASDEARSKVAPHGEDYTWVPVLRSLDQLRKGRGFSPTCFTFTFKGHVIDGDLLRPGWPWFRFQKIWTELRNP